MLTASDLAAGLAVLLPCLAATLLAGHVAVRWLSPDVDGAAYALGVLVASTVALLAAVIAPGAVGLLEPVPVLAAAVGTALALARLAPAGACRAPARAARPGGLRAAWGAATAGERAALALAAVAVGSLAVCALSYLWSIAGTPILSIDALNFNLPIPATWIGQGSVWGLHGFIPEYSNATYPHHGNALLAAAMLPFDSTMLAQLVAVPYWAAAGLAVFAVARELGAPGAAAALAGAAFAALPVTLRAGLEGAQTDLPMLAGLGAGVLFLLRHARSGAAGELVLAGLGLGLALGTKWYGLTSVAVVVLAWLLARARRGGAARDASLLAGVTAATGGPWLVRNWVETGNPLFPQALPPFFAGPEDDPVRDAGGWSIAHYLLDADVWREHLGPAFATSFGPGGGVLAVGALVAGAAAARRRHRPALLVLAATAGLLVAYVLTPYSAFGPEGRPVLAAASTRYGLPALMGAAVLAAWLARRGPGWHAAAALALAVAVLVGLARFFAPAPGDLAVGAALAAALALGALRAGARTLAAGAAAAVVLVAVLAATRANTHGYAPFDPAFAFIEAHAPEDRRIGVTGVWTPDGVPPPLPAYGRRLRNEVDYVGEHREHLLRRSGDARSFLRDARRFDLLLAGTGIPAGSDTREIDWARAGGWRVLTSSERLVLLGRRPAGIVVGAWTRTAWSASCTTSAGRSPPRCRRAPATRSRPSTTRRWTSRRPTRSSRPRCSGSWTSCRPAAASRTSPATSPGSSGSSRPRPRRSRWR